MTFQLTHYESFSGESPITTPQVRDRPSIIEAACRKLGRSVERAPEALSSDTVPLWLDLVAADWTEDGWDVVCLIFDRKLVNVQRLMSQDAKEIMLLSLLSVSVIM